MNPPKMPIHIGDYQRDTGHLRAAEHGAYLLLLFHYWSTGGLPDDDRHLSTIARMSSTEWKRARPVIERFFKFGWKHPRVDYDLEKAAKISEAAKEAGLASGRTRAQRKSNGRSTDAEPTLEPSNHLKKDIAPNGASTEGKVYAFESGVIRLTPKDFSKWEKAYSHLDLAAELIALEPWAAQQANWFHAVPGALTKKNRELKARSDASKAGGPQLPLTPAGKPWPAGII
jgi:uncharacterized protein YdaU (DUF1376 family)